MNINHRIRPSSSSLSLSLDLLSIQREENGEVLKGAWSSTNPRMEGSLCKLLATQEADKEDQTLTKIQTTPTSSWPWIWSFPFWSHSLPRQKYIQQALPLRYRNRNHSGIWQLKKTHIHTYIMCVLYVLMWNLVSSTSISS